MARGRKVVRVLGFGVAALLALLGLAFVALIGWAVYETDHVDRAITEARAFGDSADERACVQEGKSRLDECGGYTCELRVSYFISECLRVSERSPGFCKGVPKPADRNDFSWAKARCKSVDAIEGICAAVLFQIQEHCHYSHSRP